MLVMLKNSLHVQRKHHQVVQICHYLPTDDAVELSLNDIVLVRKLPFLYDSGFS